MPHKPFAKMRAISGNLKNLAQLHYSCLAYPGIEFDFA